METARIIDVAVGLIFVYLLFAVIASALNEIIAWFFDLRAKTLRSAITALLGPELAGGVYGNALITSLMHAKITLRSKSAAAKRADPSYIPKAVFADALVHQLAGKAGIDRLRQVATSVPAVEILLDESVTTMEQAKEKIATWFDGSMDRLSGEYKRHSQVVVAVIASVIVVGFNADSLRITRSLWVDPKMREALVAGAVAQVNAMKPSAPATDAAGKQGRDGRDEVNASSLGAAGAGNALRLDPALEKWAQATALIDRMTLPVGWAREEVSAVKDLADALWFGLAKLLGLLFTSLAVAMGAPFWFETLNRLVNMRSAGPSTDAKQAKASA